MLRPTFNIVDTVGFSGMVRELSGLSGTPVHVVLDAVTARVISGCIAKTPRRAPALIRRSVAFRNRTLWEGGDPDNYRRRGRFIAGFDKGGAGVLLEASNWDGKGKRPRTVGGRSFHYMTEFFHWSDARWARWQGHLATLKQKAIDVRQALRSSGVAKATWYQMARSLRIDSLVKAPGYVKNAVSRNGRVYIHGSGRKIETASELFIEISNDSSLVVNRLNGASILSRAVQGEMGYFNTNMRKGVFRDIKVRAQRYKGIFVTG